MNDKNISFKNNFELKVKELKYKRPKEFKLSDGRILYIQPDNYNFFHLLKDLKKEDICNIFDIKISDLIEIQNNFRENKTTILLNHLSEIWKWKETGDLYTFQDANENKDLFDVRLTKNQIIRRIKSKSIEAEQMEKIYLFFETQDELY